MNDYLQKDLIFFKTVDNLKHYFQTIEQYLSCLCSCIPIQKQLFNNEIMLNVVCQ